MKKFGSYKDLFGATIGYVGELYGIYGIHMIYHGDWADPEIYYKGKSYNYYAVEDTLVEEYRDEHPEDKNDDGFVAWCKKNAHLVREQLQYLKDNRIFYKGKSAVFVV